MTSAEMSHVKPCYILIYQKACCDGTDCLACSVFKFPTNAWCFVQITVEESLTVGTRYLLLHCERVCKNL